MKTLKNTLCMMIALSAMVLAHSAHARSLMPAIWTASVTRAQMDRNLTTFSIRSGSVTVDYAKKSLSVILYPAFHCPPGVMCAQMVPAPIIIQLPITRAYRGRCGTNIVEAAEDNRRVDGAYRGLRLVDNSHNTCTGNLTTAPTQITYITVSSGMGGKIVRTRSLIEAAQLAAQK